MYLKTSVFLFICLWHQIRGGHSDHDFNVDIPSYDEYTDWEPLPAFVFENDTTEKMSENLSDEEKPEIYNKNKIEEIKQPLQTIIDPLKEIKEPLNEQKEPIDEKKEVQNVIKEPIKVTKGSLEHAADLEVINEPMEDDEKDILERDFYKDVAPEKEVNFAGPVKAKGTVSIGANFGHDSCYPMSYPNFPPYFYGPIYYPLPYYIPYYPPCESHDFYLDFLRNNFGIPSKQNPLDHEAEDCSNPEESNVETSGKNDPKVGKSFGGFVPVNGKINIAAHF